MKLHSYVTSLTVIIMTVAQTPEEARGVEAGQCMGLPMSQSLEVQALNTMSIILHLLLRTAYS